MKLQGIMGFPQANSAAQFAGVLTLHLPSAFQVTQEPSVTKCCFITKEAVFLCEMLKVRYSCGGLCQSLVSFFFFLPPWTWSLLLNLNSRRVAGFRDPHLPLSPQSWAHRPALALSLRADVVCCLIYPFGAFPVTPECP